MRYDLMVEAALRAVVREALLEAEENGLPGDHHFYITFRTDHPDIDIAQYLRDRYPREMTIVLQYQYSGLKIGEDWFDVTLSFANKPERLHIPFDAVTIFADPSVNFALQFHVADDGDAEADEDAHGNPEVRKADSVKKSKTVDDGVRGEVISLDQFRSKNKTS